jgi:hypothetical protein
MINVVIYLYPDIPSRNKWIIRKTGAIYINNILFMDYVYCVADKQILKHYVSDSGCTSIFRQETLKMLAL